MIKSHLLYQLSYRGFEVAERTGLEPATSDVTGRRSNQLNYRSAKLQNRVYGTRTRGLGLERAAC
jgi:hypothetical protein